MANKSKDFELDSRTRKSGHAYWLVSGSIGGKQVRKEFSDRNTALRFQEQKNSELRGTKDAKLASVQTRLASEQVHDAEIVLAQLANEFPGISLHDLLEYYRAVSPALPQEDAARFAAVLRRLQGRHPGATLADACDFFNEAYRPATAGLTLGDSLASIHV